MRQILRKPTQADVAFWHIATFRGLRNFVAIRAQRSSIKPCQSGSIHEDAGSRWCGHLSHPFLAPAACWWARTMVESTIKYSKSGSSDIASKIRHQTPLRLQRLKRRNTLFQSPNASGRSRQESPYARSKARLPRTSGCRARSSPSGQAGL